jgi:hypothetical protein
MEQNGGGGRGGCDLCMYCSFCCAGLHDAYGRWGRPWGSTCRRGGGRTAVGRTRQRQTTIAYLISSRDIKKYTHRSSTPTSRVFFWVRTLPTNTIEPCGRGVCERAILAAKFDRRPRPRPRPCARRDPINENILANVHSTGECRRCKRILVYISVFFFCFFLN